MRKISQVYDIESPSQIKDMSIDELTQLCSDIRTFLIESISKTGGHLSSNLGIVEVTVAMHYVFDSPKDKMIFDVGHQCYTHKILTGRSTQFATLRKNGGLQDIKSEVKVSMTVGKQDTLLLLYLPHWAMRLHVI